MGLPGRPYRAAVHASVRRSVVVLAAIATVLAVAPPAPAVVPAPAAGAYTALQPQRILDTRTGVGAPVGRPARGASVRLEVAGVGGVPMTGVGAVTLNLTVTDSSGPGYVQALPTGSGALGASSNVNTTGAGQTSANLATVPVGADGSITLYDVAGAHLIADVQGYYRTTAASSAGRYQALTPARVLDSRDRTGMAPVTRPASPGNAVSCGSFATWDQANRWFWTYYRLYGDVSNLDGDDDLIPCESLPGNPRRVVEIPLPPFDPYPRPAAGEVITLQLAGRGGVPVAGASSVALTLTATDSAGPGFVQVVPTGGGAALGGTSNVNLTGPGQTVANLVVVPIGVGGTVQIYTSSGTDVIADVLGYYTDATASSSSAGLFVPLDPFRLADTRGGGQVAAGSQTVVTPGGAGGVPTNGVGAVALNLTATDTTGPGYLQALPTELGVPGASSSVNFTGAHQTAASAAVSKLGTQSRVSVYTSTRTHVVVDVSGYFTDGTTPAPAPASPLDQLAVAPKNLTAPYDRSTWVHWVDDDGDCQDTRDEVLLVADGPVTVSGDGCDVVAGTWVDPYSGLTWTNPSDLDVDHVVPLKNAHDSGGWAWDAVTKRLYANDLAGLVAVEDGLNQSKGDRGPEAWQPPLASYRCAYATQWVAIKARWHLTVTSTEHDALAGMLATC